MSPIRLAVASLAVVAIAFWWTSSDDADVTTADVTVAKAERPRPTSARGAKRKRARLNRLLNKVKVETRTVKVRALGCGLLPAAEADLALSIGGEVVAEGRTNAVGVWQGKVPAGSLDDVAPVTVVATHVLPATDGRDERPYTSASEPSTGPVIDVEVCPGATIEGVVLSRRGDPAPDVTVTLGEGQDVAITDEEGRFVLTDLHLTAMAVTARTDGAEATYVVDPPLAPEEVRDVRMRLERGRRLVGVVLDEDGQGAGRVAVIARDLQGASLKRVFSDRTGRFWLKEMPLEGLMLTADAGTRGMATVQVPNGQREEIEIRLAPSGTVVVEHRQGAASQFRLVSESNNERRPIASVRAGVPTVVSAPRYVTAVYDGPDGDVDCGSVMVLPGESTKITCGEPAEMSLVGRVVGDDGTPQSDVLVGAGFAHDDALGRDFTRTDADGRFELTFTADRTTTAWLRVRGNTREFAGLTRRNISLVPGETTDLGELALWRRDGLAHLMRRGPFGGIGGQVEESATGIRLSRIVSGGPLDVAGVVSGDEIIAIDGRHAGQMTSHGAVRLLRGEEGSAVKLRLRRDAGDEVEVEVQRSIINVNASGWVN